MTSGIEWIDALEVELTDMEIVGVLPGFVPWLVGPEHVNTTHAPPRYVLVPGGDMPEPMPDLAYAGANPPAVATIREGAMVYCDGRDYAEARALRNNLIVALSRVLPGVYSMSGGTYDAPTVATNIGSRRYAMRIACGVPVVDAAYPLAAKPLTVTLDGGYDKHGDPIVETSTFTGVIAVSGA